MLQKSKTVCLVEIYSRGFLFHPISVMNVLLNLRKIIFMSVSVFFLRFHMSEEELIVS